MNTPKNVVSTRSPAEIYDEYFVPAVFGPWGPVVAQAARVEPDQRVLDVACGTGALACAAAALVGPRGAVVGLDPNEEMLAVARRKPERVTWEVGQAEALPFPGAHFDIVVSQFGLMFFDDPVAALREMKRVMRPGGRLAVAVCDALDRSPGYAVLAELLHRLFGTEVAEAFRTPFACGDARQLLTHCAAAGIANAKVAPYEGTVEFASIEALVSAERACAWTLGGLLDDAQFARLREAAETSLCPFVADGGMVRFTMPALIITATKP